MKDIKLKIEKNIKVGKDIFLMTLTGDTKEIKNPGEFINITIPNYYLRRPISVCRYDENHVDILYKVLGRGTKDLSDFKEGMELDVLVGLGNGFGNQPQFSQNNSSPYNLPTTQTDDGNEMQSL